MTGKGFGCFLIGCAIVFLAGCGDGSEKISKGMQLIEQLDYQGALLQFEEAQALHENERLLERGRGIAYMGMTDYDKAIECLINALTKSNGLLDDMDFDINYYLAAAYAKNNQFAQAKECYDSILALRPQEKEAYFLRGNVLLKLDLYEEAKADFDKVISMEPQNYDRIISIYEVMNNFGYGETGKEYLNHALDKNDKQMSTFDSGRIYFYLGEYQKAYLALEEAKDKGNEDNYLYLGRAYEATGDYNYASSVYNSYLTKYGANAQIYNQLGMCEMKKKEYQKALDAFLLGKEQGDKELQQSLAFNEVVAYEYLEEYQRARQLLTDYLKSYPDDETAKREMQFLSTR